MYFDFEDYHPDISPVGQAISWREGVLLSIIAHLMAVILILVAPKWFPFLTAPPRPRVALVPQDQREQTQFVFVSPRLERPVSKAPDRAEPSDARERQRVEAAGEEEGTAHEQPASPVAQRPRPAHHRPRRGNQGEGVVHLIPGGSLEDAQQLGAQASTERVSSERPRGHGDER